MAGGKGKLIKAALQFLRKTKKRVAKKATRAVKTAKLKITRPKPPKGAGADWKPRVADNNKGVVWQKPGSTGNNDMMRDMDPTPQHPNGYVRFHAPNGQPLDVNGKPGNKPSTHHDKDGNGDYPLPSGWNP